MKITFVTYIYPYPDRGYNPGVERVIQELARELSSQGHEVHVITTYRNGGEMEYDQDEGVHLHRVSDSRRYLNRVGSLFSFDLLSLNYSIRSYSELLESSDVIHAFTPIVWKSFSTPLVAHYHHWDDVSTPKEYLYLPTSHQLWLQCYDIADQVITVSNYSANDISKRGVDKDKISIVPNGVDLKTYYPGPSSKEFDQWDTVLLYVGPLMERKGLKYLIRAMPDILNKHPNTGLLLVGSGERGPLVQLAENIGVKENIQFEGFVSEGELPEYYRSADVFVLPSLLEGFGMVLVEAMASGVPVVASNATSLPEVVGQAGITVPKKESDSLYEAITELLDDSSMRRSLANQAEKRVQENFTWERAANQAFKIYSSLDTNE